MIVLILQDRSLEAVVVVLEALAGQEHRIDLSVPTHPCQRHGLRCSPAEVNRRA